MNRQNLLRYLLAAGAVGASSAAFAADPGYVDATSVAQVNISGATLFRDFFAQPAMYNDALGLTIAGGGYTAPPGKFPGDTNGNPSPLQVVTLAPNSLNWYGANVPEYQDIYTSDQRTIAPQWLVNYRSTGSGGGLQDLMSYYDGSGIGVMPITDTSRINGAIYANAAGTAPYLAHGITTNQSPVAQKSIDIAVMDVRTTWMITAGTTNTAKWNNAPTSAGYGLNPLTQTKATPGGLGTPGVTTLQLPTKSTNLTLTPGQSNSIYDTPVTWVPIAFIANPGTGVGQLKMTELQYLYVTGRSASGENLDVNTREYNSGTRNGAMNSIGVDPSFGRGDYIGPPVIDAGLVNSTLGATHETANSGGTGTVQKTVGNTRLSIGYVGMDSAKVGANVGFNILAVAKDIGTNMAGNTNYVYPTENKAAAVDGSGHVIAGTDNNLFFNGSATNGWQIGGNETWVTIGDPMANNTNPAVTTMVNTNAAAYIKNITYSVNAWAASATNSNTNQFFMPGQSMNRLYVLAQTVDAQPGATDTVNFFNNTSNVVLPLRDDAIQNFGYVIPTAGAAGTGIVPNRLAAGTPLYSDTNAVVAAGGVAASRYVNQNGDLVSYGGANGSLTIRNMIAGDFNGDGLRNLSDVPDMMKAMADRLYNTSTVAADHKPGSSNSNYWNAPNGTGTITGAGSQGTNAVIEVLGDFTGNGSFNPEQARYFADGLAMSTTSGKLNRKAGFQAVDNNWAITSDTANHPAGNFFNTKVYLGSKTNNGGAGILVPYSAGASRADVTPAQNDTNHTTPGFAPSHKGYVDMTDINYVKANYGDWSNINQAATIDLSADMNGDMKVDNLDVFEIARNVMRAWQGDANLDGEVNSTDLNLLLSNFGHTWAGNKATWTEGDENGDGEVNSTDLNLLLSDFGKTGYDTGFTPSSLGIGGVTPVPEPASVVLLAAAGLLLGCRRTARRRRA